MTSAPVIGQLGLVTLHVMDLPKAVAFYRDSLGLTLGEHMPEAGWAEFDLGGVRLGIHADPKGEEVGGRRPGGASGFYFVVPDVDAAISTLRERGVAIEDEPADKPYGRDATVRDPDGNVLALVTMA